MTLSRLGVITIQISQNRKLKRFMTMNLLVRRVTLTVQTNNVPSALSQHHYPPLRCSPRSLQKIKALCTPSSLCILQKNVFVIICGHHLLCGFRRRSTHNVSISNSCNTTSLFSHWLRKTSKTCLCSSTLFNGTHNLLSHHHRTIHLSL
jgi:hypothetical protein